jgi:hypothetical protein
MIEDLETDTRQNLYELYLLKTRDVVNNIRDTRARVGLAASHVNVLNQAVLGHGKGRKQDSEVSSDSV